MDVSRRTVLRAIGSVVASQAVSQVPLSDVVVTNVEMAESLTQRRAYLRTNFRSLFYNNARKTFLGPPPYLGWPEPREDSEALRGWREDGARKYALSHPDFTGDNWLEAAVEDGIERLLKIEMKLASQGLPLRDVQNQVSQILASTKPNWMVQMEGRTQVRLYKPPVFDPLLEELSKDHDMVRLGSQLNSKFNPEPQVPWNRRTQTNESTEAVSESEGLELTEEEPLSLVRARILALIKNRAVCEFDLREENSVTPSR